MKRRYWQFGIALIAIGGSFYWVAWRSRFLRAPGEPRDPRVVEQERIQSESLEYGRALYEKLDWKQVEEIKSFEELHAVMDGLFDDKLQSVTSGSKSALGEDKLEKIKQDILGLMFYRWFQPDFEAYDRFMTEAGYRLPATYAQITDGRKDSLSLTYPAWTGKPFDESKPPKELIRELWQVGPPRDVHGTELRAIPIDPDGVEVSVERVCPSDMHNVALSGALGSRAWAGARTVSCVQFYQCESGGPYALFKRGKCVEMATAGLVLRFEKDLVFPFLFNLWFDPESQQWFIYGITIGNYEEGFGGVFF